MPEPVRGHPIVACIGCYAGDPAEGARVMQPLRDFGPPGLDLFGEMPYVGVQDIITEANPHGRRNYWSADFIAELPDKAVDVLVEHATQPVSPFTAILLAAGGGAIARVPEDDTAFGERHARFNTHYLSMWEDPAEDERNIAYTRNIAAAMKPWTTGRVYLNYIGDEGLHRVESSFGEEKYRVCRRSRPSGTPTTSSGTTRTSGLPRPSETSESLRPVFLQSTSVRKKKSHQVLGGAEAERPLAAPLLAELVDLVAAAALAPEERGHRMPGVGGHL